MQKLPCFIAVATGVITVALSANAQLSSDQVPQVRVVRLEEGIESQMAESRWRWGPLRVHPQLKLSNFGYNANIFGSGSEETSDFSATVGLGVRTIMPLGPKTFLRLDAIPEYSWYNKLAERRQFGWDAGGAFLALFNRLQIEIAGSTNNTVQAVNSEELTPTGQQIDRLYANVEVDVLKRLGLFAGAETMSTDYDPFEPDDDLNLNLLDRDEDLARIGLRYKFRPDVNVYAMYERTSAEFPNDRVFSANDGEATLAGFLYDRDRFYLNIVGGQRTIEYDGVSTPKFDDFTGSGFATLRVYGRSELGLTFRATPVYSTFVENPYFYETRTGLKLSVPMGNRLVVLGGYETGRNEYQQPVDIGDGELAIRTDDVTTWEAGLGIQLKSGIGVEVRYHLDDYGSSIDSFSREVARVQVSVRTSIFTLTAR